MPHVQAEGRTLYAESFGLEGDPALLLISGLGSQLISYSEDFCKAFVDRGFFVIRMDNRDVGLSTYFEEGDEYSLSDMAEDCVAVLKHFGAVPAHIFGFSMGGMIAQTMAIEHPDKVISLISGASRTGHPEFGRASDEANKALLQPEATTREQFIADRLAGKHIWGTPDTWHEEDMTRAYEEAWDRGQSPGAGRRQMAAIAASGDREGGLAKLDLPALVIHGGADPLIDSSGGQRTAEVIPGATYVEIEGMGHDIPITELPHIVSLITTHVAQAESAR